MLHYVRWKWKWFIICLATKCKLYKSEQRCENLKCSSEKMLWQILRQIICHLDWGCLSHYILAFIFGIRYLKLFNQMQKRLVLCCKNVFPCSMIIFAIWNKAGFICISICSDFLRNKSFSSTFNLEVRNHRLHLPRFTSCRLFLMYCFCMLQWNLVWFWSRPSLYNTILNHLLYSM